VPQPTIGIEEQLVDLTITIAPGALREPPMCRPRCPASCEYHVVLQSLDKTRQVILTPTSCLHDGVVKQRERCSVGVGGRVRGHDVIRKL
jgi:hypothetical protein